MTSIKTAFLSAFGVFLLTGCGNGEPGGQPASGEDGVATSQAQPADPGASVADAAKFASNANPNDGNDAGDGDEKCSVQATWTGDFEGSIDWMPEVMPGASGFTIEGKSFSIQTGRFNLDVDFESPFENGKTGTFAGKANYFYVTDAPYEGPQGADGKVNIYFPMDGDRVARGVPVTLEITEWQATRISGSISAGPFTGVAGGPQAPRDGGPGGPLKPITVSGSAQFHAARDFSGDTIDNLVGRTRCHQPYVR
jgi:hypothetical protein